MAPGQGAQLEKVVDNVLKSGDTQALDVFLQRDLYEGPPIKCSNQFLTKLDKLVSRSLDQKDAKSASSSLSILYKCGKNLELLGGGQVLSVIIAQDLIQKWFEKCRQLWIQCGPLWDEALFNLSEDFFDALMVVHEASKEGTYSVTESFLYPVGQLGVDPRIYVLIKKEAIRKFNLILDKIPVELKKKKKILSSHEASDIMTRLAGQMLEVGDYDLQTALMEALCRMATAGQRKELADRWFSMEHVASAFVKIQDSEFETDCRKFLNLVNGMQGDNRRVYSYPCLEVYLDKYELLMPADEKLEEFWIDFNLVSHSISFYFSLADGDAQEGQWETICINENEVQSYTVTEEGKRKVLQMKLSEVVVVGAVQGSSLNIHFSSSLDILQAVQSVYGHSKNEGFVGKKGTSVVKTTVKIIMEENSSQVVPESQVSLGENEKNAVPYLLPGPSAPVQMVTPAKSRISESIAFINSSAGSVHGGSSLSAVIPSTKVRGKQSLEMVRSSERQSRFYLGDLKTTAKTGSHCQTPNSTKSGGMEEQTNSSLQRTALKQANKDKVDAHEKNIPLAKAAEMVLVEQREEQSFDHNFVPDTQPISGRNISSNGNKLSISEMLMMPTQKINFLPRSEPEGLSSAQRSVSGPTQISQKLFCSELTQRLEKVLSDRNKDPAQQEPDARQKEMPDNKEGNHSVDCFPSALCNPKKKQAQNNSLSKRKSKGQKSLEKEAPAMASTAKGLQQRTTPNVKFDAKNTLSSKEKRDAAVAGSMVKLISNHYKVNAQSTAKVTTGSIRQSSISPSENRLNFNMSWFSTAKAQLSGVTVMKSFNKTPFNSRSQRQDIFAFNCDAPSSTGGKDKTSNNPSGIWSSGIHDSSALPSTTKKGQATAKEKRYVKKHLFSDTDTSNALTEVSWLRESGRKPKPKVIKYPKQTLIKSKGKRLNLPSPSEKPVKDNTKPSKKKPDVKERKEQPQKTVKPAAEPNRPYAASRRPKRAAATSTRSYRDPDTDESESQSEMLPVSKFHSTYDLENARKPQEAAGATKKKAASKQPTSTYKRLGSSHQSSQSESESGSEQPTTSKKHFAANFGEKKKISLEVPEVKKRIKTSEQSTDICMRQHSSNQLDQKKPSDLKQHRPGNVLPETSKLNKTNVAPAKEQMNALKDSCAAFQTSFCPSPPFIENMRSAQRSAPTLDTTCFPLLSPQGSPLPTSLSPPCLDTPSPILLLPKPCSKVSSKGNVKPSSFSAERKCNLTKTMSIQSGPSLPSLTPRGQAPSRSAPSGPGTAEKTLAKNHPSSPLQSPLSLSTLPLLTSTLLELNKPLMPSPVQSPFPEEIVKSGCHYGFREVSSVSQISLSQSSTKSSVIICSVKESPAALAVPRKTEKTPPSKQKLNPAQPHMSGPSRKRHISSSGNSEEDEKEEKKKSKMRRQHSPRMKPRKLFKSSIKTPGDAESWEEQCCFEEEETKEARTKDQLLRVRKELSSEEFEDTKKTVRKATNGTVAESESSQVISSSHTVSSSHWEAEAGDGDMEEYLELPKIAVQPSDLCQKFSSELKNKFQNRFKMIEVYNKQSLKNVQQHVISLNTEVTRYRTERLEQVREVLLEEIGKLEQEDTALKSMEKDMTMYWKKQTTAFHSYKERETMRNETLAKALQSNMCHSLEYEERIFTSQMCLIRKDMKSVQDRLLSQMQEGEIQSVKRGLRALFFP